MDLVPRLREGVALRARRLPAVAGELGVDAIGLNHLMLSAISTFLTWNRVVEERLFPVWRRCCKVELAAAPAVAPEAIVADPELATIGAN